MAINISKISINASPEKVWAALTIPGLVKLWQYGSELITTWEPGSDIRFRTEWNDQVFEQWGKVLTFHPAEVVSYTLFAPRPDREDKPENYFEMKYQLTRDGESTILEIIQTDNRPGSVQEPEQGEENPVLAMLREVAEGL